MSIRLCLMFASAAALLALAWSGPTQAQGLTERECSAKYRAAKAAGTLQGMNWNQFRRAQCAAGAAAATPPAATAPAQSTPSARRSRGSAPATVGVGNAVFPSGVSAKYANEKPGRARMLTCLDQYRANKTDAGNGGLRWIQKGGGYYSECNRRLSQR
ncbi:MAG: hypothetical protein GEU95_16260 [Rhizobiales bacterium]|nr:hypothetical protein [Hyphomicrobiales bacterium]